MALVKLRERAQITLPREVRAALKVEQGDYLEAEVVDGGVLLRPVAVADRDAARRRVREMLSGGSRYVGPDPEPSDDELMRMVVEDIEDARRRDRASGSR
jgi:AbrB family looped-hinge helix DNA binding protein